MNEAFTHRATVQWSESRTSPLKGPRLTTNHPDTLLLLDILRISALFPVNSVLFVNASSCRILSSARSRKAPSLNQAALIQVTSGFYTAKARDAFSSLILLAPSASFIPTGHCLSLNSDCGWPRHHPLLVCSLPWLLFSVSLVDSSSTPQPPDFAGLLTRAWSLSLRNV